jgi:hypothetical protein
MLCPFEKNLLNLLVINRRIKSQGGGGYWIERELIRWGKCEQGFRRMAARNKPAGIRSLVYGMSKGKAGIESLSVSRASFERGPGGLSLDWVE